MSLNRPYPAESCPDERVAANPPIVANWKLCGKCPSEKPRSPSRRSASGPVTPAPSSASPETSSSECSSFSLRRSSDITALNSPRSGSSPPTTLVPPPNGTTAMLRCPHNAQDRGDLVFVGGQQHGVRRVLDSAISSPQQVERGLAARTEQPGAWSSTPQCSAPTISASASRSAGDSADGRNLTWSGSSSARDASPTPSACSSRFRIPSESGLAAFGSPHASHFIMRYSITYAVNQ